MEFDKNCIEMLPSVLSNEYFTLKDRINDDEINEEEINDKLNGLLKKMRIILPPEHGILSEIEELIEENC